MKKSKKTNSIKYKAENIKLKKELNISLSNVEDLKNFIYEEKFLLASLLKDKEKSIELQNKLNEEYFKDRELERKRLYSKIENNRNKGLMSLEAIKTGIPFIVDLFKLFAPKDIKPVTTQKAPEVAHIRDLKNDLK